MAVEVAESDCLDDEDSEGHREDGRHPSLPDLDPVVAVDGQGNDGNREDRDPRWDADRADQEIHGLRLDDELSRQKPEVEHNRGCEEEHRSVKPELSSTLDHLRN